MQAERECQTVEVKQRSAQTCREAHVQMARPDLLLDTSRDKILAASMHLLVLTAIAASSGMHVSTACGRQKQDHHCHPSRLHLVLCRTICVSC